MGTQLEDTSMPKDDKGDRSYSGRRARQQVRLLQQEVLTPLGGWKWAEYGVQTKTHPKKKSRQKHLLKVALPPRSLPCSAPLGVGLAQATCGSRAEKKYGYLLLLALLLLLLLMLYFL